MRAAIYSRVSTSDQTCEMQLRELREYVARRGDWQIVEEFTDAGISGAKESRPQLDRLMRAARDRRFDVVLVWRFDRFARSTKHLVTALEEFDGLKVAFVSVQEQIDTATPMGRAMFTIISALAEMERAIIRERVKSGVANARARGKHMGRPSLIFRRDHAVELRASGLSFRAISKKLGVPLTTIVRAIEESRPESPFESAAAGQGKESSKAVAA